METEPAGDSMGCDRQAKRSDEPIWGLEDDLATVSCYAATELDDLILERSRGVKYVSRLVELLRSSIPKTTEPLTVNGLVDPATIVVFSRALTDTKPALKESMRMLDAFVKEAEEVVRGLAAVCSRADEHVAGQCETLRGMRSFCVALSRHALSCRPPLEEMIPRA